MLERYIERIGGDAGNMITDLDGAWLFDFNQAGLDRRFCTSAAVADRAGAYALRTRSAMFIVRPGHQHVVVTTLPMPTPYHGERNGK
ncbi:hypothetical protein [Enterobacter mori]|uniref:hypothetical protein n=1 Tax=Enterobacter mori TaxID=539813 RepID=UPI003B83BEF2